MRRGGHEEKPQRPAERGVQRAPGAGAGQGHHGGEDQRVTEASVTEVTCVWKAKRERDDIEVGEDGGGDSGRQQAWRYGRSAETEAERERNGSMRQDRRHDRVTSRPLNARRPPEESTPSRCSRAPARGLAGSLPGGRRC